MQEKKIQRDYSNSVIASAGILSFISAFIMLILFIVLIAASRPAFKEMSKYIFVTLCIDFALLIIYGVVAFLKDANQMTYALKTLACAAVVAITIFILNTIALNKDHEYKRLTTCLVIAIAVSFINLFISLGYMLGDANKTNDLSSFDI